MANVRPERREAYKKAAEKNRNNTPDNKAFSAMNSSDEEMFITGGAISISEYEHNMSPKDQEAFENFVAGNFSTAYSRDISKGDMSFKSWLETLDSDLLQERALKYEEIIEQPNGYSNITEMENGYALEDAYHIQRLAHLHTGLIEDLIPLVKLKVLDRDIPQNLPGSAYRGDEMFNVGPETPNQP